MINKIKKALVMVLAICMMLIVTACGEMTETEYTNNFQGIISELYDSNVAVTKTLTEYFNSFDEAKRGEAMEAIAEISTKYVDISDAKPPKAYAEPHNTFKEGVVIAIEALEIYKNTILGMTKEAFDDSVVDKLQEGDNKMELANEKFAAAATAIAEINIAEAAKNEDKDKEESSDENSSDGEPSDGEASDETSKDEKSSKDE